VRQDSFPVAVMPLAELEVKGQQALGLRGAVRGGDLQALGASCRAPHEGEEQRVGAPGEEGALATVLLACRSSLRGGR
jgi:hypothetical protein